MDDKNDFYEAVPAPVEDMVGGGSVSKAEGKSTLKDIKDVVTAGLGMARSELPPETHHLIHNLPETVLDNDPNPDKDTILINMTNTLKDYANSYSQSGHDYGLEKTWEQVPWLKDYNINLINLAESIIANADYHSAPIKSELYPIKESVAFINRVLEEKKQTGHAVTIDKQFDIAMQLADGQPLAAAMIAHTASRAIARDSDTRASEELHFTQAQMLEWAHSVAKFPQSQGKDTLGDNYHFWANFTMSMALCAKEYQEPNKVKIIDSAFKRGPEIMSKVRGMFGRKTNIVHSEVDMAGAELGYNLANRALSLEI